MLKNSSTLAVSAPIEVSIKLDFVSVNGSKETYFVDALRNFNMKTLQYFVNLVPLYRFSTAQV